MINPTDFRITDAHAIGTGTHSEKAIANIAAVIVLKDVETAGRAATPEEQAVLVRFCGWGGLSDIFTRYTGAGSRHYETLRAVLTNDEWTKAKASTLNSHYTSSLVIRGIWQAVERMGLQPGATVLEPSAGTGLFYGLMPEGLTAGAHRVAVELDSIPARIFRLLYPSAKMHATGFESVSFPQNFFDLVIGNMPFGNFPVYDPAYRRKPQLCRSIHDYFLVKSVDCTRPGGLLAIVTSLYTMDKQDKTVREYLSSRADLLGAIRLPNTTFQENAETDVTTDVLFFRKRPEGMPASGPSWMKTDGVNTDDGPTVLNEYFTEHPEMLLGEMHVRPGYRGIMRPTLLGELSALQVDRAIGHLPADVYVEASSPAPVSPEVILFEDTEVKNGAFTFADGGLMVRNGNRLDPARVPDKNVKLIRGMMEIRDDLRQVFRTQLDPEGTDGQINAARKTLNKTYDRFVARYGWLNSKANAFAFRDDPDQPLLRSLENYNRRDNSATKGPIFTERTLESYQPVESCELASDALLISLNERGRIEWPRMTQLTGRSAEELQSELGTLIYLQPDTGTWETAENYLSGEVRSKLATARAAAEVMPGLYERNVLALVEVQPADLAPVDIDARLGAPWIPKADVQAFIRDLLECGRDDVTVSHAEVIASWKVVSTYSVKRLSTNTSIFGTSRMYATDLIEDSLNGKIPTVYDKTIDDKSVVNPDETLGAREKQQTIKDRFRVWVWEDGERAKRLAAIYNERFNNIRLRSYDGTHLTFPGMSTGMLRRKELDAHQKNAVWRIGQDRTAGLGHVVGAGKTWTMVAAAMKLKQSGLVKKPMIVVPNHLVEQWGIEFLRLYPTANIFIAGKDSFCGAKRKHAMSKIATGTFDAVIVSHRSFEFLPMSKAFLKTYVESMLDELDGAMAEARAEQGGRGIVKDLERAKKRMQARFDKATDGEEKDDTVAFEELGVDQIFVDEADLFKNLAYVSKMSRISGLPNSDSNRAFDMFMKCRYLLTSDRGRGVVFATGTPISNTIAEMFTTLRYLGMPLLHARGIEQFDAWAGNFGEAVTAMELSPDGAGYRMHTRFSRFVNMPELLMMFRTVWDIQTAEMLKLPTPALKGGKAIAVEAKATPLLKAFIDTLVERAHLIKTTRVDPKEDNMLKVVGEGRKAALDLRLMLPGSPRNKQSKVYKAIKRIERIWYWTRAKRSTQVVFCDISTPNEDKFNIYHEIAFILTARGIPGEEIAFIHDYETDVEKKGLFDAVNAGRIRIVLGSTEKLGAGTNMQERLIAQHDLDAPWRPRDVEQRQGRIERQGNTNKRIAIYRYVTSGSFDAYMWQTLETKARFISQVIRGELSVRAIEDIEGGALTYAEIKAIASGNPAVKEKVAVDTEVRKLSTLARLHEDAQWQGKWQLKELPSKIERSEYQAKQLSGDVQRRNENLGPEFKMTIGEAEFVGGKERDDAGKAILAAEKLWKKEDGVKIIGQYLGFDITLRPASFDGAALVSMRTNLTLQGQFIYQAHMNDSGLGVVSSIDNVLRSLDERAEKETAHAQALRKNMQDLTAQANRPFEHATRLATLIARQTELNRSLDLDKPDTQAVILDSAVNGTDTTVPYVDEAA